MFDYSLVMAVAKEKYCKQRDKPIKYGTAGFREKAAGLEFVMFRMGLLAVLRSKLKKAAIGVMITASHNPVEDNGVKLVDPLGEMLAEEWEELATRLTDAPDEQIGHVLEEIVQEQAIDTQQNATVIVGRDTRPSSGYLQEAVEEGVRLVGGEVLNFGVVSTPILHYLVVCHNDGGKYGKPMEEGYFEKLSSAFVKIRATGSSKGNYTPELVLDGANGVGASKMVQMIPYLKGTLKVNVFNQGEGELNFMCGADYVKTYQKPPNGVPITPNVRVASFDGDADRLVYSYVDDHGIFHLLDGDKIATLVAAFIKKLMETAGLDLDLGLVQTAYANGASTEYISSHLGVPVACTCTGVKHLHHDALKFDVGVYFEANGHGTVIFSEKAREIIENEANGGKNPAAEEFLNVMSLINETVGDALSDLLLVETILLRNGWSAADWIEAYTDLPNKLAKVTVKDRSVITTTDAERSCETPKGLQDTINALVAKYPKGRAFVRPSGTEDIVRVYAEAASKEDAEKLSSEVALAVYDLAGGQGPRPGAA